MTNLNHYRMDGSTPVLTTSASPREGGWNGFHVPRATVAELLAYAAQWPHSGHRFTVHYTAPALVTIITGNAAYTHDPEQDVDHYLVGEDGLVALDGFSWCDATTAHTFSDFGDVQGFIVGDTFHTTANDVRLYCEALAREIGEDDAHQPIEDVLDAADIHCRTLDDTPVTLRVRDFAIEVA